MLLLALLFFPMVKKAIHDIEHLEQEHCGEKQTHFCQVEHNCSICDYHLSSTLTPPKNAIAIAIDIFQTPTNGYLIEFVSNITTSPKYTFSLRGPPVC